MIGQSVGQIFLDIRGDDSKLTGDVRSAGRRGGAAFGNAFKVGLLGVAAGIGAAGVFGVAAVNAAKQFEQQMNEVFTLLPGISGAAMQEMENQALGLASEMGILPEKVVPALYQSLSAGVPQDNVFEFLETAQKAALGGVTELETAVDGISSVVNAYGTDVISATEASDLMFTAVRLGKTNFEELSGALFNVTPTAAALGVSFEDVTAGLAAITAQGTPTSVATTQMRNLFVELSKSGGKAAEAFEQMSGQTFQQFIASGGNVSEALDIMKGAADEAGVQLQDMFSIDAGAAAIVLQGNEAFTAALDEMANSAGATQAAYEQMDTGTQRALDRLKAQFEVFKIKAGEFLLPLIATAAEWVADVAPGVIATVEDIAEKVIEFFKDVAASSEFQAVIDGAVAAFTFLYEEALPEVVDAFQGVVDVVTKVVEWLNKNRDVAVGIAIGIGVVTASVIAWTVAQAALNLVLLANPVVLVGVAIGAIAGALYVAYQRSETWREILQTLWAAIQVGVDALAAFVEFLIVEVVPRVAAFVADVGAYFMAIWQVIVDVKDLVVALFTGEWAEAWDAFKALIGSTIDLIVAWFEAIPARFLAVAEALGSALLSIVTDHLWPSFRDKIAEMIDAVVDFFKNLPGRLRELAGDIGQAGLDLAGDFIGGMIDGLGAVVDVAAGLIGAFKDALKDAWNAVVGSINTAWNATEFKLSAFGASITIGLPDNVPNRYLKLAQGGVFDRPTLGLIGEDSRTTPEIVTPQRLMADTFRAVLQSFGQGDVRFEPGAIQVNVGADVTPGEAAGLGRTIADAVAARLAERQRSVHTRAMVGAA